MYIGCIRTQLQSIKQGFHLIIVPSAVANFTAEELQMAVTGKERINIAFLKQKIIYKNVKGETKKWFWEILQSFTQVSAVN